MSCADSKNPLQHSGTSQQERQLSSLQAAYVRADEHDYPEWIVFASRFSQYLNFYNEANLISNNWQPFFNSDVAAVLGSVAIQHIDDYRQSVRERLLFLRDDKNKEDLNALKATMGSLFSAMLTLSLSLDAYLFRMPQAHPWYATLQNTISQKLQPALKKLLSYYKGGRLTKKSDNTTDPSLNVIANRDFPDWLILGRPVYDVLETVKTQNLSASWLEGHTNLKSFFDAVAPDASIFGKEEDAPYKRLQHAANHNLFVSLLTQFLSGYARLIVSAENALGQALTEDNAHAPHYALFLSFLQLYRLAQDELNTLTQRHLDFYYQKVLRLYPKAAQPNKAFLTLELGKGVLDFALPKGALFRAGKDSLGKEIFYSLDRETVFNQAKVAQLRSVYRAGKADKTGTTNNTGRLFAAPIANSADGLGKEIKSPGKAWHPFGNKTFEDGVLKSIDAPKADIGFAISSPYLFLAEGDREVVLRLSVASFPNALPPDIQLTALLTTAKGWLQKEAKVSVEKKKSGSEDALIVSIVLDGSTPAITNYVAKVHGGTFRHNWPVLKLLLANEDAQPYAYDPLRDLQLVKVSLNIYAGIDSTTGTATKTGLRQLQLANEFGPVDPAKPFQPFGLTPHKGSALIAGSEEFFKKPGAAFQLKMKWLELPAASVMDYDGKNPEGDKSPKVSLLALKNGSWNTVLSAQNLWLESPADVIQETSVFPNVPKTLSDGEGAAAQAAYIPYEKAYGPYTVQDSSGYLKLVLDQGFGYDNYQKAYAEYLAGIAFGKGNPPGDPPYVPKLEGMSLHYTATISDAINNKTKAAFLAKAIDFYHLYPFGEAEQHGSLSAAANLMLLPQFAHETGAGAALDSGELYIGLSGLKSLSAVNLLFGVMEGTADPLLLKPEQHVRWSYLSNNQWKLFDSRMVADGTRQLIQTGIISFVIPEDATTGNTLLPAGFLWIRAAVNSNTQAVCKLIAIDAQAAVVTFSDHDNAADFLNLPLAAGTISKLKDPSPSIKKIAQPYAAAGGRPTEAAAPYYRRVSERLRHKDRAITIWDYEHLILEAFPHLHRVKCLSHTSFEQLPDGSKRYNEMAPGHVTIITIPDLQHLYAANPLRPYTSESTLAEIAAFVRERISCHVTPHVVHPQFEEVALSFKLQLQAGYQDFTFYSQTLQEELTAFLTPWAFGQSEAITFGGKVNKSVLINFIEERPYVDYISHVKLYHRTAAAPNSLTDREEIIASNGLSILVSVPAVKHQIVQIPAAAPANPALVCVDPANQNTAGADRYMSTNTKPKP